MGAIEAINVLTYTPSRACAVTPTHTRLHRHTHISSLALPSHKQTHTYPYAATALLFHYPNALLASALLLLGRLNAGELGQTARLVEKGDGWLGGVAVGGGGSSGEPEEGCKGWGLDEKQLPQDGGVWIFFFFFFRGLRLRAPLCNSAALKARAAFKARGCSKGGVGRACGFDAPPPPSNIHPSIALFQPAHQS